MQRRALRVSLRERERPTRPNAFAAPRARALRWHRTWIYRSRGCDACTRSLRAGVELACSYYSVRALNSGTMYTYTTQAPTHMNTTIHYISRPQGYACVRAYVPLRQRRASTRCTLAALIICERGGAGARKEKETDFNSPEGPPVPSHRRGCWRPGRSGEAYVRYGVHYATCRSHSPGRTAHPHTLA